MDLQLYEWIESMGGAAWVRRGLEYMHAHWDDPAFAKFRAGIQDTRESEYFGMDFLAERFGISTEMLEAWIEDGLMPGRRAGEGWKVDRGTLEQFEEKEAPRLRPNAARSARSSKKT
ncbi:MAG: hypothetical protein HY319_17655 [Armatimonadetes bacterium]|nr:hypothetical protein [Armatimonadota bacterium]